MRTGLMIGAWLSAGVLSAAASAGVTVGGEIRYAGVLQESYAVGPLAELAGGRFWNQQGLENGVSVATTVNSGGGAGFARAYAYASYIEPAGSQFPKPASTVVNTESWARSVWTDVVLNGPVGGMAPVSLNLRISGSVSAGGAGALLTDFNWQARAEFQFALRINLSDAGSGARAMSASAFNPTPSPIGSGFLGGQFFPATGTFIGASNTVMVPVGVPFEVEFYAFAKASTASPRTVASSLSATANFGDTLIINHEGPAFNVPAGYTVNSQQAGIVDNRYTPVPAPGAVGGLVAGLVLAARRRRGG
jgi:hypothetical protein